MRRTLSGLNSWARYSFPMTIPKPDGPPPPSVPQSMNDTKQMTWLNTVDDAFPTSIRGEMARADVPHRHFIPMWYFSAETPINELTPWSAEAPEGAYRFRPNASALDSTGRNMISSLRRSHAVLSEGTSALQREGGVAQISKEHHLSAMYAVPRESRILDNVDDAQTRPSLSTIMQRGIAEHHQGQLGRTAVSEQRDTGRIEALLPCAGQVPVDKKAFPFRWNVTDWYEFEVTQARLKRFCFENEPGSGHHSAEVTYKVVLSGILDHHVHRLANDVVSFVRDVGRQILEEKLSSVRALMTSTASTAFAVDGELRHVFNKGATTYDDEEIQHFVRRELEELEVSIVRTLALTAVANPHEFDLDDSRKSWPHIEPLESWNRMVEFWTNRGDRHFGAKEMSTKKYEVRRFFRVIKIKMPFHSTELEKRLYDIRHWLHRHASVEFHTIYKKNIVHDASLYPVEHDPAVATDHEYHRIFSFALDWQQAPVGWRHLETVLAADTWQTIADRLGTSVRELQSVNGGHHGHLPAAGQVVMVPRHASKRLSGLSSLPNYVSLSGAPTGKPLKMWEDVAAVLGCTIEELQCSNGHAVSTYNADTGFDARVTQLQIPVHSTLQHFHEAFAEREVVLRNDTWQLLAQRLGTTEEELKAANQSVENLRLCSEVVVPTTATNPRRIVNPLLRPVAATTELLPRLTGEKPLFKVPDHIPNSPGQAELFPGQFRQGTLYPVTPGSRDGCSNWMHYTKTYLDKDLSMSNQAASDVTLNPVWPEQSVPGSRQQTPFEEDQTWFMHRIPLQKRPINHPDGAIQDLPIINHEQYEQSLDWRAP